jgi:hypothetical protein
VIFSREHEVEIRKLSTVEHTLRRIDLDAELSLHYQPIVNVGRRGWSASKRSRDGIIPSSVTSLLTSSFWSRGAPS